MEGSRTPLHITIDLEPGYPLIYVYYVDWHAGFQPQSERVTDALIVHTNAKDELVGIELLDAELATIAFAREAAEKHGAAFPSKMLALAGQ